MRAKIMVPDADIERFYNENIQQFSTPEQVRASHILLKTSLSTTGGPSADDAAVKAKAEDILKQARSGADFAELAKKFSQDEGTAPNGGDLDYFGRGRMVPEFDTAVFAMEKPGDISDLVKTQYGYHIIKLVDKKVGATKTLAEVKPQISEQLAAQRVQTQATDLTAKLAAQIKKPADLDAAAKANGLQTQESGFFARDEPILGLGASPEASAQAFALKDSEVSSAVRIARGVVFEAVTGKQDAYLPKIDEVREKVRDEVVKQKARELARQKATGLAATLKSAPDFEKAAKAAGFEAKTTDLITRDAPLPDLGAASEVAAAAFKLPQGAVSDPIASDAGTAIVKVLEKQETTDADLASRRDAFRQEMLSDRRNRFFSAYMVKAKQKMQIDINQTTIQRITG